MLRLPREMPPVMGAVTVWVGAGFASPGSQAGMDGHPSLLRGFNTAIFSCKKVQAPQ